MSIKIIPPRNPTFLSKTGVYRGITVFLVLIKSRLWVLVRTASQSMFYRDYKIIKHFRMDFSIFTAENFFIYYMTNFHNNDKCHLWSHHVGALLLTLSVLRHISEQSRDARKPFFGVPTSFGTNWRCSLRKCLEACYFKFKKN